MKRFIGVLLIFILMFNFTLPIFSKENKPEESKSKLSDEKLRRFMYFYKEKNPYLAVCYSGLIPGLGNLYAGKGGHFLTTWLIIGGSYLAYQLMPSETDEDKELAGNVLVCGVGTGYLYSMITAWYATTAYNRQLRKDISDKDKLHTDIFLVKGQRGNLGLLFKFSKSF